MSAGPTRRSGPEPDVRHRRWSLMNYPSDGARHLAETGKTVAEFAIEAAQDVKIGQGEVRSVTGQVIWGPWRRGFGGVPMRQLFP